jgi:two-component system invasion response regulator UvrY
MIKVLLADDHALVRAGLRRIVEDCEDMTVVAEAADGQEAVQKALQLHPDVVVLDISMPGMDGLEAIRHLQSQIPGLPLLVLSMYDEEPYIVRAFEAGALGYLTKKAAPVELEAAIRQVVTGSRYLTEQAAELLTLRLSQGEEKCTGLDELSMRELQVLRRLALGHTNREISEAYQISVKTVDAYRLRLLKKLHLRNNADLSRFAIQHRLIAL